MYLPPQFNAKEDLHALSLIREHPFASLVSNDDEGFPFVSHLPLHLVQEPRKIVLLGHCAKPTPHWRYLQSRPEALVIFMGPQAYMSPQVYPDLTRVPTWSYLAVHAKVQAQLIDDATEKDHLLKQLIADHEPAYADQWRGLNEDYQHKMLKGIVAFKLNVLSLQCKIKLNQHRPESHAAMYRTYASGSCNEQALAKWMLKLGMHDLQS